MFETNEAAPAPTASENKPGENSAGDPSENPSTENPPTEGMSDEGMSDDDVAGGLAGAAHAIEGDGAPGGAVGDEAPQATWVLPNEVLGDLTPGEDEPALMRMKNILAAAELEDTFEAALGELSARLRRDWEERMRVPVSRLSSDEILNQLRRTSIEAGNAAKRAEEAALMHAQGQEEAIKQVSTAAEETVREIDGVLSGLRSKTQAWGQDAEEAIKRREEHWQKTGEGVRAMSEHMSTCARSVKESAAEIKKAMREQRASRWRAFGAGALAGILVAVLLMFFV